MITAHYNQNSQSGLFATLVNQACAKVRQYSAETSLLEQWHQLIDAIREDGNPRQWVTLVNPPFIPNDRYLREIGLSNHYIRVVRLSQHSKSTEDYIQQCVQNGKSSLVAVWLENTDLLPDVLKVDSQLSCRTLVFTTDSPQLSKTEQLELAI